MGGAKDISIVSMALCFLLLIIPIGIYYYLRIKLIKDVLVSATRMTVQLLLMGIYLKYLFLYDNTLVNIFWLLIMLIVATFQAIKRSNLNKKIFLIPILLSYVISIYSVTLYFNRLVINVSTIFSAKYLVVIGGMILGNSLRGVIISVSTFYREIAHERDRFIYRMVIFGNFFEAMLPYLRHAIELSISPTLATMATMGIVSIPGMMTGQILGGATPMVAIKYQIAIMIAIFAATNISILLSIYFTLPRAFSKRGLLKKEVISI